MTPNLSADREKTVFCGVFALPPHRDILKNPRRHPFFRPKRRFGGVCAGGICLQVRAFGVYLRAFGVFLRIFTLCFFAPLYIYIFLKNKEKYTEKRVKNGGNACAVFNISILLPTRFFLPCAGFSRTFRAAPLLYISITYYVKWLIINQVRGCAGKYAPTSSENRQELI